MGRGIGYADSYGIPVTKHREAIEAQMVGHSPHVGDVRRHRDVTYLALRVAHPSALYHDEPTPLTKFPVECFGFLVAPHEFYSLCIARHPHEGQPVAQRGVGYAHPVGAPAEAD